MEEPTVGDMSITDEHAVVGLRATFQDAAVKLMEFPQGAILVNNDKHDRIEGVITIRELLSVCAEGKAAGKVRVKDRMKTGIIELVRTTPLSKTLDVLRKHQPDAVVIRNEDGGFAGYFSPDDYKEAVRKIEAHQVLVQQLQRSKAGLEAGRAAEQDAGEEPQNDLLSIMLGDGMDDDDGPDDPLAGNTALNF